MDSDKKLISEVQALISNYEGGTIEIIDGLDFSQYQTLRRVEYYSNSTYLNGQKDRLGRTKPFYNIVNAKVNVAVRATDFDTKDITVTSDKPHSFVKSLVFSHEVYQWMKRTNFAKTLNDSGEVRPQYGGVIFKKVMKDGELHIEIPEWKNLVTDQSDIMKGTIIEQHNITPVQLAEMLPNFNQDVSWSEALKFIDKAGQLSDGLLTSSDTFVLHEVHGPFPEYYIDDEASTSVDDMKYVDSYCVLLGSGGKLIVLHKEEEKEKPYKYLPWKQVSGRALGRGVVEDGLEAQVWSNDLILKQRDVTEHAAKVLYKSANPEIGGNLNSQALSGDVIDVSQGDVALLNTTSNSIPVFDNLLQQWGSQYDTVASTFDSNTGNTMPSGTPFRQTLILNQEANSIFEYRREEMGIMLTEIFEDWVLPHLAKRINREHILGSEYSPEEIKSIAQAFSVSKANKNFKEMVLEGKPVTQAEYDEFVASIEDQIGLDQAFLKVPKGYFTDFEPSISVITTGEQRNKAVQLESLFSIITAISNNPAILQDPVLMKVFGRLVEVANVGISPAELIESVTAQKEQQDEAAAAQQEQQAQAQAQQPVSFGQEEAPVV